MQVVELPLLASTLEQRGSQEIWLDMWNHFTKFVNEKGEQKARCNYCDRKYCADPKTNRTAALKYHRNNCKRKSENVDCHNGFSPRLGGLPKIKWSRHRSFLYGYDRSPGTHVSKLGTEIPN